MRMYAWIRTHLVVAVGHTDRPAVTKVYDSVRFESRNERSQPTQTRCVAIQPLVLIVEVYASNKYLTHLHLYLYETQPWTKRNNFLAWNNRHYIIMLVSIAPPFNSMH